MLYWTLPIASFLAKETIFREMTLLPSSGKIMEHALLASLDRALSPDLLMKSLCQVWERFFFCVEWSYFEVTAG
jgi:hypothetical protein